LIILYVTHITADNTLNTVTENVTMRSLTYRVAPKNKPIPDHQNIVLDRIKSCQ